MLCGFSFNAIYILAFALRPRGVLPFFTRRKEAKTRQRETLSTGFPLDTLLSRHRGLCPLDSRPTGSPLLAIPFLSTQLPNCQLLLSRFPVRMSYRFPLTTGG